MEMETGFVSPAEFARRIGRSVDWVRRAMRAGKIRHVWTPVGRLVAVDEVERIRALLAGRPTWRERRSGEAGTEEGKDSWSS